MLENLYTNNMTQEEFFKRYTYSPSRDRIGGGGFGTVYRAKDNLLHRTVAIKVSEVKTTADGQKTFSLKDEFEALNQVPKHEKPDKSYCPGSERRSCYAIYAICR